KNEVTALVGDNQDNMWVGTRNDGLCRVSGLKFSCWTTKDGLADDYVRSLYEDDEHNLWVGLSSGGLARWRIATLIPLRDEPRELREAQPAAILQDHKGYVWIGTWFNGLFRYNEAGFEQILLGRESLTDAISALLSDRSGGFWVGTYT